MRDLGSRIKELRENNGITQMQLSKAIVVNHRTISQYEKGINEPDINTIKALANFFEVTVGQLLGTEELF